MSVVAGIDCGTQSTKVLCYDSKQKKVITTVKYNHKIISDKNGLREQKGEWYIEALVNCFNQIDKSIRKEIKAIGVSGQQHGFVPLDENGNLLANVKLWCDTTTAKECDIITKKLGGKEKTFDLIKNQILPGYTASKILFMKNNNPEIYKKLKHILLPHDYLNFFLTNKYVMEEGDASGTGLYDIVNRKWSKEVIDAIDSNLINLLPNIISHDEPIGRVSEKAAKTLGISTDVIVSCGGGDNMMGAIGAGCTQEGSIVISMGTSGTIFGFSNKPIFDKKNRLAAFMASSGGYLPLLCTMNCTVGSEKIRSTFDLGVKEFDSLAEKTKPGCNGIIMLPYFNGERTPNYPNGEAVLAGLNFENTTKENIARAALESAVFALKVGLEAFIEQGFNPKKLILIGGGAKSKVWSQIVSDILELPVVIPIVEETAAFGGALQSLSVLEKEKINDICIKHCNFHDDRLFYPIKENSLLYKEAYKKYKNYDKALSKMFS